MCSPILNWASNMLQPYKASIASTSLNNRARLEYNQWTPHGRLQLPGPTTINTHWYPLFFMQLEVTSTFPIVFRSGVDLYVQPWLLLRIKYQACQEPLWTACITSINYPNHDVTRCSDDKIVPRWWSSTTPPFIPSTEQQQLAPSSLGVVPFIKLWCLFGS